MGTRRNLFPSRSLLQRHSCGDSSRPRLLRFFPLSKLKRAGWAYVDGRMCLIEVVDLLDVDI
jgi:hypothetical protein